MDDKWRPPFSKGGGGPIPVPDFDACVKETMDIIDQAEKEESEKKRKDAAKNKEQQDMKADQEAVIPPWRKADEEIRKQRAEERAKRGPPKPRRRVPTENQIVVGLVKENKELKARVTQLEQAISEKDAAHAEAMAAKDAAHAEAMEALRQEYEEKLKVAAAKGD